MTTPPTTTPQPIASPCIRVCSVSGRTGWCEGCFRTLKEIAGWSRLSADERAAVTADLPRRAEIAAEKADARAATQRGGTGGSP